MTESAVAVVAGTASPAGAAAAAAAGAETGTVLDNSNDTASKRAPASC